MKSEKKPKCSQPRRGSGWLKSKKTQEIPKKIRAERDWRKKSSPNPNVLRTGITVSAKSERVKLWYPKVVNLRPVKFINKLHQATLSGRRETSAFYFISSCSRDFSRVSS
jgi:hypothetical protein